MSEQSSTMTRQINAAIRAAGVVWHDCEGCGRDWPFPRGFAEDREWLCAVCVNAALATCQRLHAAATP